MSPRYEKATQLIIIQYWMVLEFPKYRHAIVLQFLFLALEIKNYLNKMT